MKKCIVLFICFLFSNLSYSQKHTYGEKRISLDGVWKFKLDTKNVGEFEKWYLLSLDDKNWDNMTVPGSWDLVNEYSKYNGKAWYRKSFMTPKELIDKRCLIEFKSVSMSYRVFINNRQVADVLCGNYVEQFDVTDFLNVQGENTLSVMVDNSLRWGAYFNWGGITRPVTLCLIESVHILRQEIDAIPDLKTGTAELYTKVVLENLSKRAITISCQPVISFNKNEIAQVKSIQITVPAESQIAHKFKVILPKKNVKLWHFDRPNLYESEINLTINGKMLDKYSNRFGIRKIEIDGLKFKLNGESVRLAGYNWVAEDRTTGNLLPTWRYKEDIDRMKSAGANMARLSHRPLPEEVMDYLDEKGILVVAEFNNWNPYLNPNSPESKVFAKRLVHQNYNHPSIVAWSVGNEMGLVSDNPEVNTYVEAITNYIKKCLDPNRFVLYVSNTSDFQAGDAAVYSDFLMLNKYNNFAKGVENLHAKIPGKPIFMSEYGEYGNTLQPETNNNSIIKDIIVDKLQGKDFLFGCALWTYNDYRSIWRSNLIVSNTPLDENRQWGIVDSYRNKKRSYFQMQNAYSPVKHFSVDNTLNDTENSTIISIEPRGILDIPAYTLIDYNLVWEVCKSDGTTENGGLFHLPKIIPGSQKMSFPVRWQLTNTSAFLKVTLLSPLGYSLLDSTIYFKTPEAPKITDVICAGRKARVLFTKTNLANEYVLKCTDGKTTKITKPTIDHYVDLETLESGKEYVISIMGINSKGEGLYSASKTITAKNNYMQLPPIVWLTEPFDKGFSIGMSANIFDIYYHIQYAENRDDIENGKILIVTNFGMCQVTGLENGKKYYFRVRRVVQLHSQQSEWNEIHEVMPNPSPLSGLAKVNGVIQQGNDIIVSCTTAKNASGYLLSYYQSGKKMEINVSQVEFDYIILKQTNNTMISDVTLKPIQ